MHVYPHAHRLLSVQQDNTLLRNLIADNNLDAPKTQPRCSECAKTITANQPPQAPGPDSALLLTLNKQLQQQQKKAKEQLEQEQLQAQVLKWNLVMGG